MPGDRRIPTIIECTDPSKAGVDVYTAMLDARIVFLTDPLDATVAMDVGAQLLYLDTDGSDRDISLYLRGSDAPGRDTPGGDTPGAGVPDGGERPTEAMTIVYDAIRAWGVMSRRSASARHARRSRCCLPRARGKRLIAPYARVVLEESSSPSRIARADDLAIQAAEIRSGTRSHHQDPRGSHRADRRAARHRHAPHDRSHRDAGEDGLADDLVATRDRRLTPGAR